MSLLSCEPATLKRVPQFHPPVSICKDIRPISLRPIASKVFESIIIQWVDGAIVPHVDPKQFGGLSSTSTTAALVEMTHKWYDSTDSLNVYVRVVLLYFSKAFDLNHNILLAKLRTFGITAHVLRWRAVFLLDMTQQVKIENEYSSICRPNGGVAQGTFADQSVFLYIYQ